MAGNSSRRNAGHKGKSTAAGSGGRVRRGLRGKGPTPKAEDRPYHAKFKAKQANARRTGARPKVSKPSGEWVAGRNPVLEALQAGLPVRTAYVVDGAERDGRLRDILSLAADRGIAMLQSTPTELDRLTGGAVHQGVALQLPDYEYAHPDDLMTAALQLDNPVVVALDSVQDPRNLGAIVRSAAAFDAAGVIIPERRSAAMTAGAWKSSAGAAARTTIARAKNLNRTLGDYADAGFMVVGLAGEATTDISEAPGIAGPVVLVVGSEDSGLARLVRDHCDTLASIPIAADVESLNASVAAGIALYELSRVRGNTGPDRPAADDRR